MEKNQRSVDKTAETQVSKSIDKRSEKEYTLIDKVFFVS